MAEYERTLCWGCKNTNRFKCPWFDPDNPQPVPGWVAELRTKSRIDGSYMVKECPKFDPIPGHKARQYVPPKTASGHPGVQKKKRHWIARIRYRGKECYLGYFKTEEQAIAARVAAEEAIKRGEEPRH